jgi:hypothetical protein
MRVTRLLPWCVGLLVVGLGWAARGEDLPPAAEETVNAFKKELADIQKTAEEETRKVGQRAAERLKLLQDKFCKEAKLDEAVAIRDQIRQIQGGPTNAHAADLPPAAREVVEAFDKEVAEVQKRTEERVKKAAKRGSDQLKILQDKYCKDGKLDEAVAIRDVRRLLPLGLVKVEPNPGILNAEQPDIGKVWYFEVVGDTQGSTWGTDVYTTGSSLAVTAVHAGVLRVGQKGVVKVTILPGQESYAASTRNEVTSLAYGPWHVSFKVEKMLGLPEGPARESK